MACIGNIDIVARHGGLGGLGRPGHAAVRLQPVRARRGRRDPRRSAAPGRRGGDPALRRTARDHGGGGTTRSTSTRPADRWVAPCVEIRSVERRSSTPGATPSCSSQPLRALNWRGSAAGPFGLELPSLTPSSIVRLGRQDGRLRRLRQRLLPRAARGVPPRRATSEAELTTFGRILISKMLASALANRIALHRWSMEHPEVRDERIEQPVDHRRVAPHRDQPAVHVARARPDGPAAAPVGGRPPHPSADPGGGGPRTLASPRPPRISTG